MYQDDIVPIIDLSKDPAVVGREIDEIYAEVGFCQVINHDLDPSIETAAWQAARDFFNLSDKAKHATEIRPGEAYGYGPFQAERLAASLGAVTPADLKETFSVGPFDQPSKLAADDSAAFVYSPNRWPQQLPHLEKTLQAHYEQLADLVARVLSAMAIGLGLEEHYFKPFISNHTSALRLLHYPPIDHTKAQPGQLRAGAHSDYGTLTLLHQDDAPGGLEVLGLDQMWHPVSSIPDAYVLNVGDTLARWTNDRWRSTVHRVALPPARPTLTTPEPNAPPGIVPPSIVPPSIVPPSTERHSMAFFHNANWDATIECLATCLPAGATPKYKPITAGQHLMDKFRSTQ